MILVPNELQWRECGLTGSSPDDSIWTLRPPVVVYAVGLFAEDQAIPGHSRLVQIAFYGATPSFLRADWHRNRIGAVRGRRGCSMSRTYASLNDPRCDRVNPW